MFHANCLLRSQFAWNFLWKKKIKKEKYHFLSAEFAQRMFNKIFFDSKVFDPCQEDRFCLVLLWKMGDFRESARFP